VKLFDLIEAGVKGYPAQLCHRCRNVEKDCEKVAGTFCVSFRLKRTQAEKEFLRREAYQEFMCCARPVVRSFKARLPTLETYDEVYSELWHYLLRMHHKEIEE